MRKSKFSSDQIVRMLREAGFSRVTHRNMAAGIVALHSGWKI